MLGTIIEKIDNQNYIVRLENNTISKAYIGLKPLVLAFGGELKIGQVVKIKLTSEMEVMITARDTS